MSKTINSRGFRQIIPSIAATLSFLVLMIGCENPQGEPHMNAFPGTRLANFPPNDTIAQYINQGIIPEQTLYWIGDDADGYVIAYRYMWTTFTRDTVTGDTIAIPGDTVTILNLTALGGQALDTLAIVPEPPSGQTLVPGSLFRIYNFLATLNPDDIATRDRIDDSLGTGRVFAVPYPTGTVAGDSLVGADPLFNETPTKGTFLFDSPADSNLHRFSVSAIDNNDAIDPTPAVVNFWTLPSPGLTVFFATVPVLSVSPFVLRYPTDRSPGLVFTFGSIDPSTSEREYSWSIDDTLGWSEWSSEASATVSAIEFEETGSDTHLIYLRGKNRWGVISPTISTKFRARVPAIDDPNWAKRTMIINHCRLYDPLCIPPLCNTPEWMPPADSGEVNAFYKDVMDGIGIPYRIWTSSSTSGYAFPPIDTLAQYTSVLLLAEQDVTDGSSGILSRITDAKQTILKDYLNFGGKLIFSGPPHVRLIFGTATSPAWDDFGDEIFHVATASSDFPVDYVIDPEWDFVGGIGKLGYPDARIDTTKLPAIADTGMANMAINFPRGFGQTIYEFDSGHDIPGFENSPMGVRYLAPPPLPPARPTYSVVYFGFPLYYMQQTDVSAILTKAFQDINE